MHHRPLPLLAVLFASALAGGALAQSVNVDFGVTYNKPQASYAAAGLAGEWNAFLPPFGPSPLLDLAGAPTGATVEMLFPDLPFSFDNPATTGDDQALLDDLFDPGTGNRVIFSGLQNDLYTVLSYAWAPDDDTFRTLVRVIGSQSGDQVVGGLWTGSFQQGMHYALHTVNVTAGVIEVDFVVNSGFASANGIQLVKGAPAIGTNYCTSSPNSVSAAGSTMSANGSTSLAAANVHLSASNAPAQPGLFYFGPNQISLPFGNGFRCVGGTITRMPVVSGASGSFDHPIDFGTYGAILGNLGSVNFQCWYRDPAGGGAGFNLSDGLNLVFTP